MIEKKTVRDIADADYSGKRVLVRVDFNVPQHEDGSIASDFRIRQTLPTLQYLLERGAKVIAVSHLGRPKDGPDPKYSMAPVVKALAALLPGVPVNGLSACVGPEVAAAVNAAPDGSITVLENIRFESGETKNDPALSRQLADLADIYVNDAFGAAHRAHASTEGAASLVPVRVAGLLLNKELTTLSKVLESPDAPFTAIIGGSKVSTKIDVLSQLLPKVNNLIIGGGMVFTFLKAKGLPVGNSLVEDDQVDVAKKLMVDAEAHDKVIVLPRDIEVADRFAADADHKTVAYCEIPDGWIGLDLGPESTSRICDVIRNSKTVFWNGPLGVFEFPAFAKSTHAVAESLAELTADGKVVSVLGGGDTQAAIDQFGIEPARYTHVSTGGGATLELMEGKVLPGVSVLEDKVAAVAAV